MASVSPEKYGFRVIWRDGGKRTDPKQSERFDTELEAEAFKDLVDKAGQHWPEGWVKRRGFVGQTIHGRPERGADARGAQTVYEWAAYYYRDENTDPTLKAKGPSREKYRGRLDAQLAGTQFGDTPLHDASRELFQSWVTDLRAKNSRNYVEQLRGNVTKALRAALYAGIITVDITQSVAVPRLIDEEDFDPYFATERQIDALIEGTPEKYRLAIRTLWETGLRYIELSHLAPNDVMWSRRTGLYWLEVNRSKTRSGYRKVTLPDKLGIELMALADTRKSEARLFALPPHHSGFYRDAWQPARTAAGLPTMRVHDLRHSHASWLLANGGTLFMVSKRLGHKKLQITSDLYGHLSHEDSGLRDILNSL
jgi:integrase